MRSDVLVRANDLGNAAQLGFVHDAEGLHEPAPQHFWRFIFGKGEKFFERDLQVLGDQFEGVDAGVMHAPFQSGKVARVDFHEIGQHFLCHAALLAEFLDSPSQLLSCCVCHAIPSCAGNVPQEKYGKQGGCRL